MLLKYHEKKANQLGITKSPLEQMKVLGISHRDYDPDPLSGTYVFTVDKLPHDLPVYIENLSKY